ncbi:piRNA biogenesis protein EXD1-like [Patiria miniata]|uniref:3'-5' exonuclease domain-containing protein n=1 Tax=Patiria miniata TaxID=46514 RepID=A0A913ZVH6_PATMI|nr:piRNA biogenesis protein EXD1-like [Patiria miniata]
MATAGFSKDYSNDQGKSECMGPTSLSYQLIDKESQIKPAIDDIGKGRETAGSLIAVDCEGQYLSRKGKLSVVSIATENQIYIFDIQALGESVFDKGLRDILDDYSRNKLMFDCREDSDCLMHQYNVKLVKVLDLQLLQIMEREATEDAGILEKQPLLESFLFCLVKYVKNEDLIKAKEEGDKKLPGTDAWLERPLSDVMLKYAACDVMGIFKLYSKLKHVCKGQALDRLRVASDSYLDIFRSLPSRSCDSRETSSHLPKNVIPSEFQLLFLPQSETECITCHKQFPYFDRNEQRGIPQLCQLCKLKINFGNLAHKALAMENDPYDSDDDDRPAWMKVGLGPNYKVFL